MSVVKAGEESGLADAAGILRPEIPPKTTGNPIRIVLE
jgi:hypothetical protein